MDRNEATSSAMIQLMLGARRAVYSCKERTTKIRVWAAYRTAVSQGIIFALYFISVCLGGMTGKMQGQILLPTLHNINETASSLLFFPFHFSYSEHSYLLLGLCSGLLQLGLSLLQLAFQGMASCLQVADLRFTLLKWKGQLCHLTFNLQLLFLMLQPNLQKQRERPGSGGGGDSSPAQSDTCWHHFSVRALHMTHVWLPWVIGLHFL